MALTEEQALELIYVSLGDINAERVDVAPVRLIPETKLIGSGRDLDSLEIVNLIVGLETRLAERLKRSVVLVNEDAFGGDHVFRDVGSLAQHIVRLSKA